MRIIKNFIRMFCELFFVYASEKRNEKKSKGIMKKITKQNKTTSNGSELLFPPDPLATPSPPLNQSCVKD